MTKNKIDVLDKMKSYAQQNDVPIICCEGLSFLLDTIKKYQVKKVLEIGSAIGYSALAMSDDAVSVDTIEKDKERYELAIGFLEGLDSSVNLIFADALLYEDITEKYDLIFIDAAKAQYEKFFNKYEKYLSENGVIVCDNLNFHNLNPNEVSRNTRQLLRKINVFKTFLKENENYQTTFYQIGDGMSVSVRKRR